MRSAGSIIATIMVIFLNRLNAWSARSYLRNTGTGKSSTLGLSMRRATASLDERTLWRLSLKLQKQGFKDVEAVVRLRFIEDRGYEPPSGRVFIEDDYNGLVRVDEKGYAGFGWTLSEDKNDRKDGLWVWGLFEEPKYPFLYMTLAVFDDVILASGESEPIFGGAGVPNSKLNIRFNHARDAARGAVLSSGQLTAQITELVKADPLGLGGTVNVGDVLDMGSIDIQPVLAENV